MNQESRVTLPRTVAVLAALALLLVGAGATYLLMNANVTSGPGAARDVPDRPSKTAPPSPAEAPARGGTSALPDVEIQLGADAVKRAGILATPVSEAGSTSTIRLPGVVAPNAYHQVTVTPLVSGRITAVAAQLGERVRKGQAIAEIYSPELAEARTRYVSAVAMLEAHDRELQRTQKLVEIGAASRQELERIHAEHLSQTATVQSARARLGLLGVAASRLDKAGVEKSSATTAVPAPIDGIVTERTANVGLNVDPATKLFTVMDLSTVWIVADVHERDMARVRVGSDAAITSDALSGNVRHGRISYIDPQVSPETRTAKARIELANSSGELRLGMYVDVVVTNAAVTPAIVIPKSAVQNVGGRTVVYLADANTPGKFIEREVRLGQTAGDRVEVTSGVESGDLVVRSGSFYVRAERDRLGLRSAANADGLGASRAIAPTASPQPAVQTARISVTDHGLEPAKIVLKAGGPAKITFVRTSDKTCATEVVIPSLNLKRALPLNEPVDIELTSPPTGEITFTCGMDMLKGVIVVQ
jgi:membrane fusion protein, heavy metal efflux system